MRSTRLRFLFGGLLLSCVMAHGQSWGRVGFSGGGLFPVIVVDPADSSTLYPGADVSGPRKIIDVRLNGGVLLRTPTDVGIPRSTNAGQIWSPRVPAVGSGMMTKEGAYAYRLLIHEPTRQIIVAPSGGDYTSIQAALNAATPGDTILVRAGTYHEKVTVPTSGTSAEGPIALKAYPGETPVLDGSGISGRNMILLNEREYVTIDSLTIRNNTNVTDGSGIRLLGACRNIELRSNEIYDMRGSNAMGITVYGTNSVPASNVVIEANHIHDCDAATSEALVLNGNITDFLVRSNVVHDINNIGIDFIGGEVDVSGYGVCRNGRCTDNLVYRCRSIYGGGYAGGIYVDGGKNIRIERNVVHDCDLGIELGAENTGFTTTGIVVRANIVFANDKVGIIFGGYDEALGRVAGCEFISNVCYKNDTLQDGNGELAIQWASNNVVRNNIFYGGPQNLLIGSYEQGNTNNTLDYNVWYVEAGAGNAEFAWKGDSYTGFSAYTNGTGQDAHSIFVDPRFTDPAQTNFHVANTSSVVNAGDPTYPFSMDEKDIDF